MHEQEWGGMGMQGGMGHSMGGEMMMMKMMVLKNLNPEQQRALMLRAMDLKIRKKELMVYFMQEKVKLMQEKINMYRMVRDMLAGSMGGMGGPGFR
jgi:hypothetical protein